MAILPVAADARWTAFCAVRVAAFAGEATERKLSASSVNHHRTIVNDIFNFAVQRGRFDRNPVAAVRQRPEPPGRDRIVSPAEFRTLWDKAEGDREMRAFLALAGTTTLGERQHAGNRREVGGPPAHSSRR